MKKLTNKCVVWLPYLDASKTRREGRRIPKKLALNLPEMEEMVEAAQSLNLNPQPNFEVKYPKSWWQRSGSIVVNKIGSKNQTLLELVKKIGELRRQKEAFARKV